jgi:hypothetical protein
LNASVSADKYTAGLLAGAVLEDGFVVGCHSSGSVVFSGDGSAGGLVGNAGGQENHKAIVSRSFSTASVTGTGQGAFLGGLVGDTGSSSAISESYATGAAIGLGHAYAGGFVGISSDSIVDSYAMGNAESGRWDRHIKPPPGVGGFVGYAFSSTIQTSYSTGAPKGHGRNSAIGGFAGRLFFSPTFVDTYWDIDTSGIDHENGAGIVGLSDAQLRSGLPDGFDPAIWGQDPNINNGYPYLRANPPPK